MSLPSQTSVLIVGAGPAGLASALSLLYHGFYDFIIIDALPQGHNASRAVSIHAATLEALESIGCGDEIVLQGVKSTTFNIGTRSTKLISPDIENLKSYTRYPYVLFITQNVIERIFGKKLAGFGIAVHRPLRVAGLKNNLENPLLSDVIFEDGRIISAKYVVAADGAHSAIRSLAGIGFSEPAIAKGEADNNLAQMVGADVSFETTYADDLTSSATLSAGSLFLCSPLPFSFNDSLVADGQPLISDRIYRIGCGVPLEDGEIPHSPPKEYLQNLIDRFGPYNLAPDPSLVQKPLRIKNVVWSSRFRNRAYISDTAFTRFAARREGEGGVIFLIGDASRVIFPAAGQGLNLSLRDAILLGEALTKHIHASETKSLSEADTILREFAEARRARALEVIKLTKGMLSVMGLKHRERLSWWFPFDSATIRALGLWILGKIPFVRKKMAWDVSGLSLR